MFVKSLGFLTVLASAQAASIHRRCANASVEAVANVVYDGRVSANATAADFDSPTGPFGPDFVKGQSMYSSIFLLLSSGV